MSVSAPSHEKGPFLPAAPLGPTSRDCAGWGGTVAAGAAFPRSCRAAGPRRARLLAAEAPAERHPERARARSPLNACTRARPRSGQSSREEPRSESEQPLVKESDMHRQLGNVRRWRRAGHAPQRTRGAVPAAGHVLGGPRGGNATRGVASTGVARVRRPCGDKAPPFPGSCPPLPLHARAGTAQDAYGTESQALGDLLDLGVNLAKGP